MTTDQRTQRLGEFIGRVADAFRLEQPHVVEPDIGRSAAGS
jgi:hypothetical protein